MGDAERMLIHQALRFAVWAAGEGIAPAKGEDARGPEDFLFDYSLETDETDWETLPDRILSSLSPSPEAQQQPHEVLHVYDGDGGVIIRENGNISTFGAQTPAVLAAFESADTPEAQQEPPRPAEQAVTKEMVARALEEYICGDHHTPEQAMGAALKAAMEAGR